MGAGANVTACIYLPVPPAYPLQFNFTTHADACMNDSGTDASLAVSTAGVSQVSIGYVESKVSGCTCISAASNWTLSYNVTGQPYSGSVQSTWNCPPEFNSMTLNNPGTTTVGTTSSKGSDTYQQWHGTGNLYIVFQPVAAQLLTTLPMLKFFSPPESHETIDKLHAPLMEPHYLERLSEHFE